MDEVRPRGPGFARLAYVKTDAGEMLCLAIVRDMEKEIKEFWLKLREQRVSERLLGKEMESVSRLLPDLKKNNDDTP